MNDGEARVETVLDEKNPLDVKDVKRARRLRLRILLVLIALTVTAGVALVLIRTLCKVGEITVTPTELYDEDQIVEQTGISIGDHLFSFSSAELTERLERSFPYLKNIKISRILPSGVHVGFTEELGDMCLRLGDDYYPIDDSQTVLKRCSSPDDGGTHRITVVSDRISRCVVGEKIEYTDTTLFQMVDDILRAVEENGVLDKIDTIDLRDKFDVVMDFDSRFEIELGSTENLKYKIAMVMKVVEELYEDDSGVIDVRETSTAYVKLHNK